MRLHILVVVLAALLAGADLVAAADKPAGDKAVKEDLAKIQGKWKTTREFDPTGQGPGGKMHRWTKEIDGNKETITIARKDGEVVAAWTVDIKVSRTGLVRIFTFTNVRVTAGPRKGETFLKDQEVSYIYTVKGDTFAEAQGFLGSANDTEAKGEPTLTLWKRVNGGANSRP